MSTVFAAVRRPLPGYAPLRPRAGVAAWLTVALLWDRRRRDRARLARTLPCHLEDMGLDAAFVAAECAKPFWRA